MKDEDIRGHKQEVIKIIEQQIEVVNNGVLEIYRKISDLILTFFEPQAQYSLPEMDFHKSYLKNLLPQSNKPIQTAS